MNGDAPAMEKFAENITINTVPEPGKPVQPIEIKKLRKWPTTAGFIGIVSGVITIAGALPGIETYQQFRALIADPDTISAGPFGTTAAIW